MGEEHILTGNRTTTGFRRIVPIVFILSIIAIVLIPGESTVSGAPSASFKYSPDHPLVGDEITFDASGSWGDGLNYSWDFGDNHREKGMVVVHSYEEAGDYIVVLSVVDSYGEVDTATKEIHVMDEISLTYLIISLLMMLGFFIVYFVMIFFTFILYAVLILYLVILYPANIIICGVLGYRIYKKGKEADHMKEATPYLVALIISGAVSIYMPYFALFSVIAHFIIYGLFKKKLREVSEEPVPKKKKKKKKKDKSKGQKPITEEKKESQAI
ncbi:MAG: PKD domain-containing protein [Thermoplasmatota archaeon]